MSDLAHADHPVASPLGDDSVDRLLARAVAGQGTVLDLGCGDGTWLLRALRREPALTAVGVDHSDAGFDRVREQAERVAVARGRRLEQAADDDEREALAAAPAASPLVPGRHLGVSAQPKNLAKRRRRS